MLQAIDGDPLLISSGLSFLAGPTSKMKTVISLHYEGGATSNSTSAIGQSWIGYSKFIRGGFRAAALLRTAMEREVI